MADNKRRLTVKRGEGTVLVNKARPVGQTQMAMMEIKEVPAEVLRRAVDVHQLQLTALDDLLTVLAVLRAVRIVGLRVEQEHLLARRVAEQRGDVDDTGGLLVVCKRRGWRGSFVTESCDVVLRKLP